MKQQGLGSYWSKTYDGGMYMRNHKQIDKLPPEAKEQKDGTIPSTITFTTFINFSDIRYQPKLGVPTRQGQVI